MGPVSIVQFSAPTWLRDLRKGRVREAIRGATVPPHDLVLDAEGITHADSAGLDALADLSDDFARDGVTLRVARMKTPVQDRLEDAGIAERIGRDHSHPTVRAAADASATAAAG